ncbi:hypothetical protein [Paenibacillus sp. MBLB4367]|uniref:hypothetical protein n=1 Tax=Paenibacillus sp. MBLB4367 TaxID=3384767 RepID=UPI00390828F8
MPDKRIPGNTIVQRHTSDNAYPNSENSEAATSEQANACAGKEEEAEPSAETDGKITRRKLLASLGMAGAAIAFSGPTAWGRASSRLSVTESVYGDSGGEPPLLITDQMVVLPSGRTQRDKNSENLTPFDFGAIGDGTYHPLSERYSTLAEAQAVYSHAAALTDSIDWAALQAFFNYCHSNRVVHANVSCNAVINKTLTYKGNFHATNVIYGNLHLTPTPDAALDYFLVWQGYFSQFLGAIRIFGYQSNSTDMSTRNCKNGVLLGGNDGFAVGSFINSITADNLQGYALVIGQNSHFVRVGFVRGGYVGSAEPSALGNLATHMAASWSGKTDANAGTISGSSTITVDVLPPLQTAELELWGDNSNTFVVINGELHIVYEVNRSANTLKVVPQITSSATSGTLNYIFGGTYITLGNNTANTSIDEVHGICAGIGNRLSALYGTSVKEFTSEFCGIGVCTARRNAANYGSVINQGYFEGNTFDHVETWSHPTVKGATYNNTTALDKNKMVSLYTFLSGGRRIDTGGYQKLDAEVVIGGKTYSANDWQKVGTDLTDSLPLKIFATNGQTLTLTCDEKIFSHYGKASIIYCFHSTSAANGAPTGNIVLNAGAGLTINGGSSVTFKGSDYQQSLMLVVSRTAANTLKVNAINKAEKKATLVYDPPSIPTDTQTSTTLALPGAVMGDIVVCSINRALNGMRMWAEVTATDTVTIYFRNDTGFAIDLANLTIAVKIV